MPAGKEVAAKTRGDEKQSFLYPDGHAPTACPLQVAQPEPQGPHLQEGTRRRSPHSVLAQGHLVRPSDPLDGIFSFKRVGHARNVGVRGTLGSVP